MRYTKQMAVVSREERRASCSGFGSSFLEVYTSSSPEIAPAKVQRDQHGQNEGNQAQSTHRERHDLETNVSNTAAPGLIVPSKIASGSGGPTSDSEKLNEMLAAHGKSSITGTFQGERMKESTNVKPVLPKPTEIA